MAETHHEIPGNVTFNDKAKSLYKRLLQQGLTTKPFKTFVQDAYYKECAELAKASGVVLIAEDEVEEYATIRN